MSEKLAISGGTPVRTEPLPPWPFYAEDEVEAVSEVLRSGRVNAWTGQDVSAFEKAFSKRIGVKYAIALANGTVALELALRSLGIGVGDEVIVTPRTFIASISSIVLSGAKPVFADIDEHSQNITAETIQQCITDKTRAILLVHLAGWPCEMVKIASLVSQHDLFLIEDCAQAHGAEYHGKAVGTFGHMAAFSFCQDKIMTTGGEGGMLVTNDNALWKKAWSFKDHGKNPDKALKKVEKGDFRWLHDDFGTNWRMTGVQAAIGTKQVAKLDDWIATRHRHADRLNDALENVAGIRVARPATNIKHAYYKYYCFISQEALNSDWDRDKILDALWAEGIPCGSGSCSEVYKEKAFEGTGFLPQEDLPVASKLGEISIMLMVHPTLRDNDISDMITAITKVMKVAAG